MLKHCCSIISILPKFVRAVSSAGIIDLRVSKSRHPVAQYCSSSGYKVNMNGQAHSNGTSTTEKFLQNLEKQPDADFVKLFNNLDAVMFDCDGVLWLENRTMKDAQALIIKLRAMGKKVFFATNNSTKTRGEFLTKFNKLGFETTEDEIISTSYLAALYLKEQNFNKKVYVIGTTGVTQELNAVGIETLPIGPDSANNWDLSTGLDQFEIDPEVGAVVVGFDQHISFIKLLKAATYLEKPGAIFIATNTDERFPVSGNKYILPGTGAVVAAVKTAAEREPVVMGKPSRIMFDHVRKSYNLDPSRTLMVGDRGNTDIMFGRNCNMKTLLVLTGVTSLAEARKWESHEGTEEQKRCLPNFYLDDVASLLALINKNGL